MGVLGTDYLTQAMYLIFIKLRQINKKSQQSKQINLYLINTCDNNKNSPTSA